MDMDQHLANEISEIRKELHDYNKHVSEKFLETQKCISKKFDEQKLICMNRIPICQRAFVPSKIFYWVMAVIVTCMLGFVKYGSVIKSDVVENTTKIEMLHKDK